MNGDKKQFVSVSIFFSFIIISIIGVIVAFNYDSTDKSIEERSNKNNNSVTIDEGNNDLNSHTTTNNSNNNNNAVNNNYNSNSTVKDSKPVQIVTKTTNNTTSNKKGSIPISYFITELDNDKIYVGSKTRVRVDVKPDNATDKSVKYTSSNTKVATVSKDGIITGVGVGDADIYISVAGGKTSVSVKVIKNNSNTSSTNSNSNNSKVSVKNINLSPSDVKIGVGVFAFLRADITPSNATNKEVIWSSSDSSIVSVSGRGLIEGKKVGTAYIIATTKDGLKTAKSKVTVTTNKISVTKVMLNRSSTYIDVGYTRSLVATVYPETATNKTVMWKSSNTSIATVDGQGVVKGIKPGTVTITATTQDGKKTDTCKVTVNAIKNGWVTENGKKYYYKNNVKQTNTYIDYIYLNKNGEAQAKMGNFTATMYGALAWANRSITITKTASSSGTKVGTIPTGGKMTILSAEVSGTKFIKVKYGSTTGYINSDYIFINLPDVMPDVIYSISNASSSVFKTAGYSISNITGKNLYGFSKKYNSKIGKDTYYAPLLYPVAKKFQKAYNSAKSAGYNFKVYDTYRPRPVEELVTKHYKALYDSNSTVRNKVNYDASGNYWGYGWFMTTTGTSRHCQAIALDLALTDKNGKELSAQSKIHMLDTSSLRKYNNSVANKLSGFMTNAGFSTLASEWWHYEDNTYKGNAYNTFYIK